MADVFDQVAPQQQSASTQGDVFDQVDNPAATPQQPQQQDQPGFLQRAWEGSPGPGIIDAAKGTFHDLANAPQQQADAVHNMVGSLKSGDLRGAANHAMALLFGSESPVSDAAKGVVKQYVQDAQKKFDVAELPGGTGAKNYVADVKAGNTRGAVGDVIGGVSSIAPMLLGDEASATKAKGAVGAVADTAADVAGKAKGIVSEDAAAAKAQPEVQGAIRDAAEQQSNLIRAREGVGPEAPPSVRDAVQNVADAVKARSKAAFQTLDEASNGRWQRFDDQLSNLRDKMDEVSGIDDEAYSKFEQRAQDVEAAQTDLVNRLVDEGRINPDLAEQAKTDYKQSQALYDVSQQIRSSASGLRPELGEGTPETIDPAKLSPRLNKLYDSGRLQQALGAEGAAQLVKQVDNALRTKSSAIKTAKLVKSVAKWAGIGAGATILGQGAAHVLGGHQ